MNKICACVHVILNNKHEQMLNQNRFRVYPKTGPVPEEPVAPLPAGIDMLFDWPCLK